MIPTRDRTMKSSRRRGLVPALLLLAVCVHAQQSAPPASSGSAQLIPLDRVVAIVNGDLILESDVDDEERFGAFQPFRDQSKLTHDQIVERLIDRQILLQQAREQPEPPITDAQVDAELATLRKNIPACVQYHCETDAGWQKFVDAQGFALDDLRDRWRLRMELLRFIDQRFRMGIRIPQSDVDDYYRTKLIPAFAAEKVSPPAEAAVTDRIREILLQQQVTKLLEDWLQSLRAQGSVRVMKPGEATP